MAGPRARNRRLALGLAAVVPLMLAMSYAAVPLYDWFCRVTGYGGTTGVAAGPGAALASKNTVTQRSDTAAAGPAATPVVPP